MPKLKEPPKPVSTAKSPPKHPNLMGRDEGYDLRPVPTNELVAELIRRGYRANNFERKPTNKE